MKDINRQYVEAVELYEQDIASFGSLDSYINLAFLYWSFAFELFEFNIPNNIVDGLSVVGGTKYQIILELGLKKYPRSGELKFWQRYFSHIIYGDVFSEDDCHKIIKENHGDNSTVPYFYLYLFNRNKYQAEKSKLIDECNKLSTAKNMYIKSILETD